MQRRISLPACSDHPAKANFIMHEKWSKLLGLARFFCHASRSGCEGGGGGGGAGFYFAPGFSFKSCRLPEQQDWRKSSFMQQHNIMHACNTKKKLTNNYCAETFHFDILIQMFHVSVILKLVQQLYNMRAYVHINERIMKFNSWHRTIRCSNNPAWNNQRKKRNSIS